MEAGLGRHIPRRERQRSPSTAAASTRSPSPALAISGAGTERGPALPWAPLQPPQSLQLLVAGWRCSAKKARFGDAPEMPVLLPAYITLARGGLALGWVRSDAEQGCKGSCLFRLLSFLLKGTQQEERELGNLYPSPASSKGLGSTGRSILGWYLTGSPELCRASCCCRCHPAYPGLGASSRWVPVPAGRELGACLSPLAAGESPGSSLHKASWSRHVGRSAPRHSCSLCALSHRARAARGCGGRGTLGTPPRSPCAEWGRGEERGKPGQGPRCAGGVGETIPACALRKANPSGWAAL